jgi:predicted dehydrogenase
MGPRVRSDVSIIEDYMIHDLYMFLDLFGTSFISDIKVHNEFQPPIQSSSCNLSLFTNDGIRGDFYSSWIYPDKERKIVIVGDKGSFIWEGESLYYDSTKWVKNKTVEIGYREIIEPIVSKSNLELELDFFILGERPNVNCVDVWSLLTQIKNKL